MVIRRLDTSFRPAAPGVTGGLMFGTFMTPQRSDGCPTPSNRWQYTPDACVQMNTQAATQTRKMAVFTIHFLLSIGVPFREKNFFGFGPLGSQPSTIGSASKTLVPLHSVFLLTRRTSLSERYRACESPGKPRYEAKPISWFDFSSCVDSGTYFGGTLAR
jgi:hypothetical protein